MKRMLRIISLMVACCLCVSCSANGAGLKPTDKLVLYCKEHLYDSVKNAVIYFQNQFPNVDVETKIFSDSTDEYSQILRTEMMAGKGPDLLLFGDYEFQDIEKAMEAGIFFDIDTFLESDESLNPADFHPAIFDGGYYKGKRLYIPLCYDAISAVTTEETLASFGLQLSDISTFKNWVNSYINWVKTNPEDTRVLMYSAAESPYFYCKFYGVRFLDLESKQILIDSDEFHLFMEFLKLKFSKLENGEINPRFSDNKKLESAIQENKLCMYVDLMYLFRNLGIRQTLSQIRTTKEIPLPAMDNDRPMATSRIMAAINNSSSNKLNAYEFMKVLLSVEVQSNDRYYIPVNNKALDLKLKLSQVQYDLTDEERKQMYAEMQNLGYIHPLSYTQYDLFEDSMRPWFLDEKSYEACIEDFRNRLEIFVEE